MDVNIDIRPHIPFNFINLNSKGKVQAAILSSADFDATLVNPETVTLAGAPAVTERRGWPKFKLRDVNRDGLQDMLLRFGIQEMQLVATDTEAALEGETYAGVPIRGTDTVIVIPRRGPRLWRPYDGSTLHIHRPNLQWLPVAYATCYLIQIDNNEDFNSPEQEATIVRGTRYRANRLTHGQYYWRVQVGGSCNIEPGPFSEVWSVIVAE